MSDTLYLPNKQQLKNSYETLYPIFTHILSAVETKIKNELKLISMPTYKSRVKSFKSYYQKLLRIKPKTLGKEQLPALTDLLGIRVICPFLEDIQQVITQVSNLFSVIEVEQKGADRTFMEFGYESVHVLIEIPEEIKKNISDCQLPSELVCEIQIRTILQDAWAEVEHELIYKSEFSPFDLPLRRKLASMNASLSLADIVFQEIRDYQNKLNQELDHRRTDFYSKTDNLLKLDSGPEQENAQKAMIESMSNQNPYVHGTIDDLILEAIHAHNTGNLDLAIQIYSLIIDAQSKPNTIVLSVIYKHRGMAYFAKNMFDLALQDFESSIKNDEKNARSYYYAGIALSVQNKNEEALEYFNKSIALNNFQSHVYYRRALTLYHLSDYAAAMSDLNVAKQLGLDNEECENLNRLILKKLKMDV